MKRWNIAALLLAALGFPFLVMAYIPFVKDLKRNVATYQGQEIVSRLVWFTEEFKRAPLTLRDAHVPAEDIGEEIKYYVFPAETTRFMLSVHYSSADSAYYDSKLGSWK